MNKSRVILSSVGGVIGLIVLVLAYFDWSAYSAKTAAIEGDDEGTEGLEAVEASAERLSKKDVYPCAASVKAVASNETLVAAWKDEAFKLAARGDLPPKPTTTAQFKQDMVDEAQRLLKLPGTVQGTIAKPEFAFGPFKDYIAEGKMPAEAQLAELQRQWGDVVMFVETLAKCGVAELLDVQFKAKSEKRDENLEDSPKSKKAKGKKGAAIEPTLKPSVQGYVLTFATKPQGLIKSLNAFETCERFVVIEDFAFTREKDVIQEALGGGEKKDAAPVATSGRRRRRSAAAVQEVKKEDEGGKPKNGIITDPQLDAPLKVVLTLSTYDFKTLAEVAQADKEEEKK